MGVGVGGIEFATIRLKKAFDVVTPLLSVTFSSSKVPEEFATEFIGTVYESIKSPKELTVVLAWLPSSHLPANVIPETRQSFEPASINEFGVNPTPVMYI